MNNLKEKKGVFKRLFFDIETSPNIVFSWNVGYNINLDYSNIINERAIICICYKWEHENKVRYLTWNKGDDSAMVKHFAEVINSADEVIGHNSDRYDIKWFRTRCLYHGVSMTPYIKSIDTLKLSRGGFKFNSNRLDYISKFIGLGGKMDTGGFDLWKKIVLNNDKKSLTTMVAYCKRDVLLLEAVFKRLNAYSKHKTNRAVLKGKSKCSCPECTSDHTIIRGYSMSALGIKKASMQCRDCNKYFRVSIKDLENR